MQESIVFQYLDKCKSLKFDDLTLYYTDEILITDLIPYQWNHYVESYILANFRLTQVTKGINSLNDILVNDKEVKIFFTTDRKIYLPLLKESGHDWVTKEKLQYQFGYVSNGIYTHFSDTKVLKQYLPPTSVNLDGTCHEFTHILLYQYLGVEKTKLDGYYDILFNEGIAVLLNNQYRYLYNMKKELDSNKDLELQKICIKNIKKDGLMAIDNRFPVENFAYQYSATVVKMIDDKIRKVEGYKSDIPLSGILKFIKEKIEKGNTDIYVDLRNELKIDVYEIENELRKELEIE